MHLTAFTNTDWQSIADSLVSFLAAFLLGGIIGLERQYRQRTAGLRTNVLVSVGAAAFVDIGVAIAGPNGAAQVIAYTVAGVGFLGAGVIMNEEGNIRGLNTAATLWGSAAVGAACGADLVIEAALATAFVLAANTLLRPLVNYINRQPIDIDAVETTVSLIVIANRDHQSEVLDAVNDAIESAELPAPETDIEPFGDEDVQFDMTFPESSVETDAMDALIDRLDEVPFVEQAFWTSSTSD